VDPRRNPYNPGAGLRPAALAGRDSDLEAFEILMDRADHSMASRSIVFHGLRGVGKTVLLAELAGRAAARNWLVLRIEAERTDRDHFSTSVAFELLAAARKQRSWFDRRTDAAKQALASITSFQLAVGATGVSLGVERSPGVADTGTIQFDLVDLAETVGAAAAETGVGVVLFVDEMQELSIAQMSAVCRSSHRAGQIGVPWYVVGGGLPNLPTLLAEAESYAERLFDYRAVGPLGEADARFALTKPAADQQVTWAIDAAAFVLGESGGYPFFIQQFGKNVWDVAAGTDHMSLDDATIGVAEGQRQLDSGFYSSRWERATPAERELLRVMAVDDGVSSRVGDLAERLGRRTASLGPARARLIAKGIVYSPEHGKLSYTVPGMADFVRRTLDD
jgi:hypothetical protein